MMRRDSLDAALTAYYDAEAAAGARATKGELRVSLRRRFAELLDREGRRRLVDVGAGPGLDVGGFVTDGFDVIGLDLAPGNVRRMRERGLAGVAGSLYALPFGDGAFDAVWTMSTLVHVPDARFDDAIGELLRIVRPGAPVGIGSWGGRDWEGTSDTTRFDPPRFFSLRDHDRWRSMLERHATVESLESWTTEEPGWEYQFVLLRSPEPGGGVHPSPGAHC